MIAAIYARLVKTKVRTFLIGVVVGYAVAGLMGLGPEFSGRSEARRICMQRVAEKLPLATPDILLKVCR